MYIAIKTSKNPFHKIDVIYNENKKPLPNVKNRLGGEIVYGPDQKIILEKWLKSCQIILFQDRECEAKVISHVWRNYIYKTETDKIGEDKPSKKFLSDLDLGIETDCIEIIFTKIKNGFTRAYFKQP